MKFAIALSVLSLVAATSSVQAAVSKYVWENALKPKGLPGEELTLAKDGRALYGIMLPASPSTEEQKAANDLAQWLGEMTGARFVISRESGALKDKIISVGHTELLAKSAPKIARADLGDEGYAIDEVNGDLFLTGSATEWPTYDLQTSTRPYVSHSIRGPINAVYALLEEDLGCRWYSRFSQTIPTKPTLKFRPTKRSYVPVFEIRDPYYWEAFDGTWSLRNRTNSSNASVPVEWGGNKAYALFIHTFDKLVPPDTYFKQHPEYFSEHNGVRDPGQLCVSNPEVVKIAAESVKMILRGNPGAQMISVSQNDGVPCCDCPQCRALALSEGSLSGPLLKFVNAVADEVGKEFPNVKISTLAYLDTFMPPKTIRPHKNVAIQLCTDSHAWAEPFQKIEETEKFQTAMKAWAAAGANIDVWDYTVNFSHYAAPMPNWQVVTDSIRFFAAHNAKGVMLQGNYQTPGTSDGYMRTWVWAKQLWDPSLDTRALMKDFVFGYYGKAARPIWDYETLQWNMWEKEHHGKLKSPEGGIRYHMDLFDADFMTMAKDCFARAEAAADNQETLRRVEEAELQVLYAEIVQQADSGKVSDPAAFKAALDKFERIAHREKMTHTREGSPDLDDWLAKMRKLSGE